MLLQLTDIEGEACLIETDHIVAALRDKDVKKRPYTALWFGPEFHIRVQETPAAIYEMVDEIVVEMVEEDDEEEAEDGLQEQG
jgi:hypothetical protein